MAMRNFQFQQKLIALLRSLARRKEEVFFRNVLLVFSGSLFAGFIGFIFTILAGRFLGPVEYGKANIVFSIGGFLMVLMTLGLPPALVQYIGKGKEEIRWIASTVFSLLILWSSALSLFFLVEANFFANIFHIESRLFLFAILYAMTHVLVGFFQSFFQGVGSFKQLVLFNTCSALVFGFSIFLFFPLGGAHDFSFLIFANILRWVLPIAVALFLLRSYIFPFWIDRKRAKGLIHYGMWAFFGIIPGYFFGHLDKLMLYYFLGSAAVGFYSAYYLSATLILDRGVAAFLAVFFPHSVAAADKAFLFRKINKGALYAALPVTVFLGIITSVALAFFGDAYHFDAVLIVLFSVNGFLYFLASMYIWLLFSAGGNALRFAALNIWVSIGLDLLFDIILIPLIGIRGAVFATIIAFLYIIAMTNYYFTHGKRETMRVWEKD